MIATKKFNEYKVYVNNYMNVRNRRKFVENDLIEICSGINSILLDWTGNTYVGIKKEKFVEQVYQEFFELLHEFLEFCYINAYSLSNMESSLAQYMMFHGTVYRYLGINDSRNYRKKIVVELEFNDVYVSWSKSEYNLYIESKLYGPRTWMKAEIVVSKFGIDIHGFEQWCEQWFGDSYFITRGSEREVVFPTIEECISELKYI